MTWDDHARTWENVGTRAYAEAAFASLEHASLPVVRQWQQGSRAS